MAQNIEYIKDINDYTMDRRDDEFFDVNIFRYKFSDDFIQPLYQFSKIHQYDHRKDFKEAWNIWIEEIKKREDLLN